MVPPSASPRISHDEQAAGDVGLVDQPVVVVRRPVAADRERVRVQRLRIGVGDLLGVARGRRSRPRRCPTGSCRARGCRGSCSARRCSCAACSSRTPTGRAAGSTWPCSVPGRHVEEEERLHVVRLHRVGGVVEHRARLLAAGRGAAVRLVAEDQRLAVVGERRRVARVDVDAVGDLHVARVEQRRVDQRAAVRGRHAPDREALAARARRLEHVAQDDAGVVAGDAGRPPPRSGGTRPPTGRRPGSRSRRCRCRRRWRACCRRSGGRWPDRARRSRCASRTAGR